MWEPNPLNFRTVRGCCRKIEKIEAKQSREKLNSADRGSDSGEATKLTTCHFHILTHHLLTHHACWRTSFRPWSRFLHSDVCDSDNYSRTADSLPALPAVVSRQEFILLFYPTVLRERDKSLGNIYVNYERGLFLIAVQVKAQEIPDANYSLHGSKIVKQHWLLTVADVKLALPAHVAIGNYENVSVSVSRKSFTLQMLPKLC